MRKYEPYKLLWSNYGEKDMQNIPADIPETAIVIAVNALQTVVEIVQPSELSGDQLVKYILNELTSGTNYSYNIIQVVGNAYFCN